MDEKEKELKIGSERKLSSQSSHSNSILFSSSKGFYFSTKGDEDDSKSSGVRLRQQNRLFLSFSSSLFSSLSSLIDLFKRSFLPIGYPHSVKKEYLEYQFFDSLQGLCSYLRGVLCTHAVLVATGVGSEEASAWSAAITWVMRDGVGMLFSIFFTTSFSTYFGSYIKEWRLFADFINDVALTLDMISPFFPRSIYMYILFLSAICKTMCGISANSTKLCITNHLCLISNESDVNAKEGSQETAICLIGLALGVLFSSIIGNNEDSVSTISTMNHSVFFFLTLLHFYSNYRAISCLRLETINRTRAYLLIQSALSLYHKTSIWKDFELKKRDFLQNYITHSTSNSLSLSLSTINQRETVWLTLQLSLGFIPANEIYIGASLKDSLQSISLLSPTSLSLWQNINKLSRDLPYCIVPRVNEGKRCRRYDIILRTCSTHTDQLKAYCHCLFVNNVVSQSSTSNLDYSDFIQSFPAFEDFWSGFLVILNHEGWNLIDNTISMDSNEWVCEWGEKENEGHRLMELPKKIN